MKNVICAAVFFSQNIFAVQNQEYMQVISRRQGQSLMYHLNSAAQQQKWPLWFIHIIYGLIFVVLTITLIGTNNIAPIKYTAEIWECGNITKKKSPQFIGQLPGSIFFYYHHHFRCAHFWVYEQIKQFRESGYTFCSFDYLTEKEH